MKERPEYSESVTAAQQENQQLRQQLQQLQQVHREETQQIVRRKERELGQIRQQLQELQQSLTREREDKVRQLGQVRQQLESSENGRAKLEEQLHEKDRRLSELEGHLLRWRDRKHLEAPEKEDRRDTIELMWREGRKAPFADRRWCDAIVDGNRVYFRCGDRQLWIYDIRCKGWSQLPDCL